MNEYELAGIEVIARGVCVQGGKILLCRTKGGATTYLPGGHVEFGETGRQLGVDAETGAFLGVVENAFEQHGKPHAEVNLVYELKVPPATLARACEDWIEFEWRDLAHLDDLLPDAFRRLSADYTTPFSP